MKCTYCGGTKFYEGPSGGMAVNVLCANPNCRHWFNDAGPFGFEDLHRVEPTEEEKETEEDKRKRVRAEHDKALYDDGFRNYINGVNAKDLIFEDNYQAGDYIIKDNIFRLAGWLDGLREDVQSREKDKHPHGCGPL